MKYNVIIVEDDPMVAKINSQYVEKHHSFSLKGVFADGKVALNYLMEHAIDLIILDVYMPVMDGIEFLKKLNETGKKPDVIMVTAASDVQHFEMLLNLGVFDYLIKPFEYSRFVEALDNYITKREYFDQNASLSQNQIDSLLLKKPKAEKEQFPSKGLQKKTLEAVRECLVKHKRDDHLTSETIADEVKLSRVTVRRYMNYLIELSEVESSIDYNTGGRPSIIYHYKGLD